MRIADKLGRTVVFEPDRNAKWYDWGRAPFSLKSRRRLILSKLTERERFVAPHIVSIEAPSVVLVKNSKAGCTTLAQIMYYSKTGRFLDQAIHIEKNVLTQGIMSSRKNMARVRGDNRFLFTSVRHPETRAVSAFRNLILEAKNAAGKRHIAAIRDFGFDPMESDEFNFDVFLEYVDQSLQMDRYRTDRHWREQVNNTGIDLFEYDFVSRLENISQDLDVLLEKLRVPRAGRAEILDARFNRSSQKASEITPGQRRYIEDIYKNDFETFGY